MANSDIMTLPEVAEYLRVSEKSVLRMVRRGEIPVAKVASQWRFVRSVVEDWLLTRTHSPGQTILADLVEAGGTHIPISRLVAGQLMVLEMKPAHKTEILTQLVDPLVAGGHLRGREPMLGMLSERERMMSTAVGDGVAFPHVRDPLACPVVMPVIVLGRCVSGTDFGSYDGLATRLFFLICARSHVLHLSLLTELAYLGRDPVSCEALLEAKDEAETTSILVGFDQRRLQETASRREG